MRQPDDLNLSREEGEALIERLETQTCTAADLWVVAHVVRLYFWLFFALKESKLSLERFRVMLFGDKSKPPKPPPDASLGSADAGESDGGLGTASADSQESDAGRRATSEPTGERLSTEEGAGEAKTDAQSRPGHRRLSIEVYSGAERVECRHHELAPGDCCPVCGIGWSYSLPPGCDLRINGHALLAAIRYEVEKLRCSACGERFTATLYCKRQERINPPRARSALGLSRYFLGVPFDRLEVCPGLVGVSVPDATPRDQVELVADCAYPVFEYLVNLAVQGNLLYQDDTPVQTLSLIQENRNVERALGASARRGVQSTALGVESGG